MGHSTGVWRKASFVPIRWREPGGASTWLQRAGLAAAPAAFLQHGTKTGKKKKLLLSSSSRSTLQKLHNFSTLPTDVAPCVDERKQKREKRSVVCFFKISSTYTIKNIESAERLPGAPVSPANHGVQSSKVKICKVIDSSATVIRMIDPSGNRKDADVS